MDETRKKFRICLICVVTAAVLLGLLYYVMSQRHSVSEENGTLVSSRMAEGGNDGDNGSDFIY